MLALLAVVVFAATPAPVANDAPVKPRTPLGVRRAPVSPEQAPSRVPLTPAADADGGESKDRAPPEVDDDTDWARDDAPPRPLRKRPTPEDIWNEKTAPLERPVEPAPAPIEPLSAQREKRFIGALLGGVVGLAAPMLFMPLADRACVVSLPGGFPAFVCPTPAHVLIGIGGLVAAITGAGVGVALAGGEVPGAAMVTGTFVGLVLALAVAALTVAGSSGQLARGAGVALLGAGAGLVVVGQAVAMLLRDDAIEERPWLASSAGRLATTSLAFVGTLGGGLLVALLLGITSTPVGFALAAGVGVLSPLLAPLAAWGAHRAMDGKGTVGVSYLSMLGVGAIGFLGAFLIAANSLGFDEEAGRLRGGAIAAAVVGGTLLGTLGVPLALEASHAGVLIEERGPKVNVSLGGAPVAGGAMGVVTARF
ncbi:MAG: hypothetical protein SFW67_36680 [Myxococcaceae bacterium]|nr:hypothetical protein [Myxococcaceae bacterium]